MFFTKSYNSQCLISSNKGHKSRGKTYFAILDPNIDFIFVCKNNTEGNVINMTNYIVLNIQLAKFLWLL